MTKKRKLAEKIARALMTVAGMKPVTVERLAMMKKQTDSTEREIGGRCTQNVVVTIEELL